MAVLAFLCVAQPTPDSTIRGKAGSSEIVIKTTKRLAGAIHSVTWNGKEFIDSTDHGRQLQSASNFDLGKRFIPETFNPTEAGSMSDGAGPKSSSKLLKLEAAGDELRTTIQMAFWLRPGEKSDGHVAYNDRVLSEHLLTKRVKVGMKDLPHAIEYDTTFVVPKEPHRYAQFEAVTGYMPWEFDTFWKLEPKTGKLHPLDDGPGEQPWPVVLATADGNYAMGAWAPHHEGFQGPGFGRWRFKGEVVKWNIVFRIRNPDGISTGDYRFRNYVAVGTLEEVRRTLTSLQTR
ncbi:MAG: hypothetical protein U0744_21295 [Gemmataceae bacterium]